MTVADVARCPIARCRDPLWQGEPKEAPAAPLRGSEIICAHHAQRLARTLDALPRLFAELATLRIPTQREADKVTTSRTPPVPINLQARACQEDMLRAIADAERLLRYARRWSPRPPRGREGGTLAAGVAWCRTHLEALVTLDSVGDTLAAQLFTAADMAHRLLGHVERPTQLPAPCPSCDTLGLERGNGWSVVKCRYCGRTFHEDEYDRLVELLLFITDGGAA